MPFTLSHPAAVLPFLRTDLPASALVAGSMAPDLPLYLPFEFAWRTHTATAVITVDLVLAGALWASWHGLFAPAAVDTAPTVVRRRLMDVRLGLRCRLTGLRDVGLLLLALVLGAATHVLWDEFTHPRRWGAEHLPVLAQSWADIPGYRWAQELSGALGLLVLLVWLIRWWRRAPALAAPPTTGSWWGWLAITVVGVAVGGIAAAGQPDPRSAAVVAATSGGTAALTAAVVLATAWHLRRRTRPPQGTG